MLNLLRNREALAVNQNSANNRQVRRTPADAVWMADVPGSPDRYLALFNLAEKPASVKFELEHEMLRGKYKVRDLWAQKDLGGRGAGIRPAARAARRRPVSPHQALAPAPSLAPVPIQQGREARHHIRVFGVYIARFLRIAAKVV